MKDFPFKISSRAVVRGMGVFCPLASDCAHLEVALTAGTDSISTVKSFDASHFLTDQASAFGAEIDVAMPGDGADWMDRATLFTVAAYREAMAQAGLHLELINPERIAVCLGSSHSGLVRTEDVVRGIIGNGLDSLDRRVISATLVSHCTAVIKRLSGAKGQVMTISSACASSNSAIGIGADMIRRGEADVVIAGGADTVSLSVMAGFNALRALASDKTAPFAQDIGLSIGEGAGIVILTRADLEVGLCDAPILAQIAGYGLSGDAHHATAPDQNGAGAVNAILAALDDAAFSASDIGYVNAHGTGTEANDGAESRAIAQLFGDRVPVSSTKSYYGHTLGASGVIETITSILLGQRGIVPANLRMHSLRDGCEPLNYATTDSRMDKDTVVLVNNFGFGGNNSSLLMRLGDKPDAQNADRTDTVVITGLGLCSAAGQGVDAFRAALAAGAPLALTDLESGVDIASCELLRFTSPDLKPFARTSPTTKQALVALKEALGANMGHYHANPRSGLISGVVFGAQKPTEKFMESVFKGDPALANAHYFPMITMNATGGACSLAFGIKGYNTTVCGSGAALSYAADLAASGRQDRVAVVSGDEMTPILAQIYHRTGVVAQTGAAPGQRAAALAEFGAAVTLERTSSAIARGAQILGTLRGWATRQDPVDLSVLRGGDALQRALTIALDKAGVLPAEIARIALLDAGLAPVRRAANSALAAVFGSILPPIVRPDTVFGLAPSSGALMTLAAAMAQPRVLVLAAGYDVTGEAFAFVIEGATP